MTKVTVCEMRNRPSLFEKDWKALTDHVAAEKSDLVLLPEMVFSPWMAAEKSFDPAVWDAAVAAHDRWIERLAELGTTQVIGTRPITASGKRFNQGFVWHRGPGPRLAWAVRL